MSGRAALLAGAVLFAVPAGAAERPRAVDPAAAVPCPRQGPGFVVVPGTTTCIRIAGRVAASATTAGGRRVAREDVVGSGASARIGMETRSDTAYGPVRAVVRVRAGQGADRGR